MPRMTGLRAVAELRRRKPRLRTLILLMHQNERYLYEALKAGASGDVLKAVADRDLVEACRAAMRGEAFLYPEFQLRLVPHRCQRRAAASASCINRIAYLPPIRAFRRVAVARGGWPAESASPLRL